MDKMEMFDPGAWLVSALYTVLHASLLACPVIVLIIAVRLLLRNRLPAQWTYLLWLLVPIRLLFPWTPDSSFSIYNVISINAFGASDTIPPLTDTSSTMFDKPMIGSADSFIPLHNEHSIASDAAANKEQSSDSHLPTTATSINTKAKLKQPPLEKSYESHAANIVHALAYIWLTGASIAAAAIVRANVRFARKLRHHATELHDPEINGLLDNCKRLLRIRRKIIIYRTDLVISPALTGIVRPMLLMPASLVSELDERQLQHILLHELSHLKRNDLSVNAVMQLLLAFHWFNPLLFYAYSRMREDQELACDSLALSRLRPEEGRDYALTLIRLLEGWSGTPGHLVHSANLLGNRLFWQRRMRMIQSRKPSNWRRTLLGAAALILIAGCSLTGGKTDKPVTEARQPSMEDMSLAAVKLASAQAGEGEQSDIMVNDEHLPQLLASIEGAKVYGSGTNTFDASYLMQTVRYDEFTIVIKGRSYSYPWQLLTASKPQIRLIWADTDRDGKDELIVIITSETWHKDKGNARRDSVHIIRPEDGSEIAIEDPVAAVKAKYKSTLLIQEDGNVDVFLDTDIARLHQSLGQTNFGSNPMDENVYVDRYLYADYFLDKLWVWVSGTLTDNQGANITFTSFLVQYDPDMNVSSISIRDLDSWEVAGSN